MASALDEKKKRKSTQDQAMDLEGDKGVEWLARSCFEYALGTLYPGCPSTMVVTMKVYDDTFKLVLEKGVVMATHNHEANIEAFARSCFEYAFETFHPGYFCTKASTRKEYDGLLRGILDEK